MTFEFYRRPRETSAPWRSFPRSHTRPLSLLQLDFLVDSRYESAAVVGIIVVALTAGVALVSRLLGFAHRY